MPATKPGLLLRTLAEGSLRELLRGMKVSSGARGRGKEKG